MMPQGSGYHGICLTVPAPHPPQLLACWDATGAASKRCMHYDASPAYLPTRNQNEISHPGRAGSCHETAGHHSSSCCCGPTPATPFPNTHTSHLSLFVATCTGCGAAHCRFAAALGCLAGPHQARCQPQMCGACGTLQGTAAQATWAHATSRHKAQPCSTNQHSAPHTQAARQRCSVPQHAAAAAAKNPRHTQPQGPEPSWRWQGAQPGENCLRAAATAVLASRLQHDSAQACSHGPIYPRPPANELLIDIHHVPHSQVQHSCTEQRCCDR
jgi:hypothetical protein